MRFVRCACVIPLPRHLAWFGDTSFRFPVSNVVQVHGVFYDLDSELDIPEEIAGGEAGVLQRVDELLADGGHVIVVERPLA